MSVVDTVANAFSRALNSEPTGDGETITLPIGLSNGNLVQLYVERLDDDRWLISDKGQAAFELAVAGVSLDTHKAAAGSWQHLVRSLSLEAPIFMETGEFDLAGVVDTRALGRGILELAENVVRGEGLRALAPTYRARRFRDVGADR